MANRYWVGGTGTWNTTSTTNWSSTSGGAGGASVPTTADAVIFNSASAAGNYTVTIGSNVVCSTFDAGAPASGTATITMSGAFVLSVAGASFNVSNTGVAFGGTTGTISATTSTSLTITTNNVQIPWSIPSPTGPKVVSFGSSFNNSGYTGANYGLHINSNSITLNINGYTITTSSFRIASNLTNTTINFGSTGAIYCTGVATSPTTSTCSIGNPTSTTTLTGSKNIYLTRASGTNKFLLTLDSSATSTVTKDNSFNFIVTGAGLSNGTALVCDNLDLSLSTSTSSFPVNSAVATSPSKIFGNVTLGSYNLQFANMSFLNTGTQTITTSGGKLYFTNSASSLGMTFGVSTTLQLQSPLSIAGAVARNIFHTQGVIDLNGYTLTIETPITLQSTGSTTRTIAFGSNGSLVMSASGSVFTASGTNLTITGTGTISLTSGSAKTFAGGGYTNYPTLDNGGAGALTISGSNSFAGISNSVQPTTFTFTSGTTQTVAGWNVNGTAGNSVTIDASTAGAQATLNYSGAGTITSNYLSIKDSSATPANTWTAKNSTDLGNNTGWAFDVLTGAFIMLFL